MFRKILQLTRLLSTFLPSGFKKALVLKRRPAQGLLVDPNRLIHKQQMSPLIHMCNVGAKVGSKVSNLPMSHQALHITYT